MTDNKSKSCWIFDIDGTMADGRHRQHLVKQKPKNWPAYKKLAYDDAVYVPVVRTLLALYQSGNKIFICSGRSEDEREITNKWLLDKCHIVTHIPDNHNSHLEFHMRQKNDHREDSIIKREILHNIIRARGFEPMAAFDDRNRVVQMWRSEGIHVFHVDQTSVSEDF